MVIKLLIDDIVSKYDLTPIPKCCEHGYSANLAGLNNPIIFDGESITKKQKICDCFVFINDSILKICLVELKSSTAHPSDIQQKFQNGVFQLQKIFTEVNFTQQYSIQFVLMYRHISAIDYRIFQRTSIKVQGRKNTINLLTYDCRLIDVFKNI